MGKLMKEMNFDMFLCYDGLTAGRAKRMARNYRRRVARKGGGLRHVTVSTYPDSWAPSEHRHFNTNHGASRSVHLYKLRGGFTIHMTV